jgi:hypothetical protein
MRGKARWRAVLIYVWLILALSSVVWMAIGLFRHRSWDSMEPWLLFAMLLGLLIERAAHFPFGPDYIPRSNVGMADWVIRSTWFSSIVLYIVCFLILAIYGVGSWNGVGGLLFYFGFGFSMLSSKEKFRSLDSRSPGKLVAKEDALA